MKNENEKGFTCIIRMVLTLLTVGFCLLVLLLWIFGVNPQTVLNGVTIDAEKPHLSIRGILDGNYQQSFDSYFSDNFPLRSFLIKGYDQIMYSSGSMVNDIQAGVGRDLHGKMWLDGYLTYKIDEVTLEEYEKDLSTIKNYTDYHGIPFLYMISPNKAEVYSDTLPWNYRIADQYYDGRKTAKMQILEVLDRQKIEHLDTTDLIIGLREDGLCEPFSKTGIHWNDYGAAYVLQAYIDKLNQLGEAIPQIVPEYSLSSEPEQADVDYKELLNVYHSKADEDYPHVHFSLEQSKPVDKSVYTMSTSYQNAFVNLFKENDMPFLHYKRLYYNQLWADLQRTDDGVIGELWNPGIPLNELDYGEVLEYDIFVIEHNAGELPQAHIEFVSRLADYIDSL